MIRQYARPSAGCRCSAQPCRAPPGVKRCRARAAGGGGPGGRGARGAGLALPQCSPRPPGAAPAPPGRTAPLLPQSPPPTPSLPPRAPPSPEPRQTPLSPRPAPQPRRPQPRRRPRGAFPGGHGGAPGLPTLGLGPFAPSAAPRRLPAPTGAQRLRAPRTRIPAGGSGQGVCGVAEGGGVGAPKLLGPAGEGAGDRFLCSLGVGAGPGLWGTRGSRSVVTRSWRYPWDGRREPDP